MADLQSRFHLTFFFLIFLSYVSANRLFKLSDHMYGGLSEAKPANYEIQKLIDLVHAAAEAKAGQKFEEFKAKSFKSQVVAGMNYFVKVDVGGGKYVHLRVYQPLPYAGEAAKLVAIQLNKTADDEIQYF